MEKLTSVMCTSFCFLHPLTLFFCVLSSLNVYLVWLCYAADWSCMCTLRLRLRCSVTVRSKCAWPQSFVYEVANVNRPVYLELRIFRFIRKFCLFFTFPGCQFSANFSVPVVVVVERYSLHLPLTCQKFRFALCGRSAIYLLCLIN